MLLSVSVVLIKMFFYKFQYCCNIIIEKDNRVVSPLIHKVNFGESPKFKCDLDDPEWFVRAPSLKEYNVTFSKTMTLQKVGGSQSGTFYCIGFQKKIPVMGEVNLIVYGMSTDCVYIQLLLLLGK